MKRLAIVFAVLFVFSVSAHAQMGEGMKPEQKGQMGQGKTGVGIKAFHHKNHLDGRFELAGDHDGGLQNPV